MKAIKVSTENIISVVEIEEPAWRGMGKEVGGSFEHVLPRGLQLFGKDLCMIVNEEGKLIGLIPNSLGTDLYNFKSKFIEPIVGDILIMADGFANGEPDIIGLTDTQIEYIRRELVEAFDFLTDEEVS